ncbi:MAG: hypothetical protein WA655_11740 [Candidatus Korobacteraceae bacterium]
MKQLRQGVDLWPLIAHPRNPAEQRINATLTRLNQRLAQAVKDCDKQVGDTTGDNTTSDDWSRTVEMTMTGPHFLSLVASDEVFCGGAHPDSRRTALVFDMNTGAPVDWTKLVAASAGASAYTDTATDGSTIGALVLPALQTRNVAAANADCKDVFQDPQSFLLWPDAKSGMLVAEPFDLPHAVAACAQQLKLTMPQARQLGFSESLLSAIEEAHRQIAVSSQP